MLNFGSTFGIACAIAVPNVSLAYMKTTVFGAVPVASKISFWLTNASPRIVGAVGKLRNTNL